MIFAAVNNHINSSDSSSFIDCHHYPSFNYFSASTELYKIALVPTLYYLAPCAHQQPGKNAQGFSVLIPKYQFCYLPSVYGLLFSHQPRKPHAQQSLECYTYLTHIQGLPEPTNVPMEKHINYQFSRFSELYSHNKLGHQQPMSPDCTNLLPELQSNVMRIGHFNSG